jgi:hypothetical protein
MKTLALLIFCFASIASQSHAQNPGASSPSETSADIGGFLNVAWGTSREEAKKIMSQRHGVAFKGSTQDQTALYFTGGTFSDFDVQSIILIFWNDRLCGGQVIVKPKPNLVRTWYDVCAGLMKKYGNPARNDRGGLSARWDFPTSSNPKETIFCGVSYTHEGIALVYTNEPMQDEAQKALGEGISTKDM